MRLCDEATTALDAPCAEAYVDIFRCYEAIPAAEYECAPNGEPYVYGSPCRAEEDALMACSRDTGDGGQ